MNKKILLAVPAVLLLVFVGYVASRPSTFRYERSAVINASPDKIFPYLDNFKLGAQWNPYEKKDPSMRKTYSGPESGVGAKMAFSGNNDVGEGNLEVIRVAPNSSVELRLEMTKPMAAVNTVQYTLTPEGSGTRFSWAMAGDANFLSKLVGVFIDCDKMIAGDFSQGIQNLKMVVESQK